MIKVAAVLWFALCNYLFFSPANKLGKMPFFMQFKNSDKVLHTVVFFVLTLLFMKAFATNQKTKNSIAFVLLFYGFLVELIQKYFVASRSFDIVDILADGVGISLALIFISIFKLSYNKQHGE